MKKVKYLFLLVAGVWITGCTPYQTAFTNEEHSYPATVAEKVQLFFQGETIPKATEVGEIVVLDKSENEGVSFLQKKAAEMGADGIVNVEVKVQTQTLFVLIFPIPIHSYFVSGTAIKISKPEQGLQK